LCRLIVLYVKELESFGFETSFTVREKRAGTQKESAFMKADTKTRFLMINGTRAPTDRLPNGRRIFYGGGAKIIFA